MTLRQQKYKKNRLAGQTQYAAAINAGYSKMTARIAGSAIEDRMNFDAILQKHGLTDDKLADYARRGLEANKQVIVNDKVYEYDDWSVRHKYFESVLKLRGKLSDALTVDQSEHNTLIFEVININAPQPVQIVDQSI